MNKSQAAYNGQLAKMALQLKELENYYNELLQAKTVNWGDVGDIQHTNSQLAQITDRYMKRGEFA